MRSIFIISLASLLTGCGTYLEKPPKNIESICSIFKEKPHWKSAIQRASGKWNTHVPTMMSIIYQESSFVADARPMEKTFFGLMERPRSSAVGYSQALDGTWATYIQATKKVGAQRTSFSDSVDFMGWYLNTSQRTLGFKLTDAKNHYLAYHEGWTGYKRKSYAKKPWLVTVSGRVQNRADRFSKEYSRCR